MNNLKERAKGEDAGAIKKSIENVMSASQAIGKIIYEQSAKAAGGPHSTGGAGSSPGDASSKKKDDDVIDAEYEVKS